MSPPAFTLSQLQPGQSARIVDIRENYAQKNLLQELGFTINAEIRLIRRAPLGDPLHVRIRDSDFVLRQSDADCVEIERIT